MMRCLRCGGKGLIDRGDGPVTCHRCKGRTVVDGEWERHQIFSEAAKNRRLVRLISGRIVRMTFWGSPEEDRVIVKWRNDSGKIITMTLKKASVKELI